ncbi:MAG: hypothetical protein S4CHLAM2_09090 [Chlamydiales bacterium]|nr:hypothetical protein [Chlamydiales bacterium]
MFVEIIASAPILFFLLGVASRIIRSDLDIPHPLPKFFSIYVLSAIGLKGGVELGQGAFAYHYLKLLFAAVLGALLIAIVAFWIFKRLTTGPNAVALAASYGSISAVTFITGSALLDKLEVPYGPYMIAAMALMESPAILVAMFFYTKDQKSETSTLHVLKHSLTNNSIVLLIGSFCIGLILTPDGWGKVAPFYDGIFYGMLTLFLLDLGLAVVKRFEEVKKAPFRLFVCALIFPMGCAFFAFFVGQLIHASQGDTFLLMLLFGSASYIAAPAAMRTAVKEANPSLYLSLAMGITFPFNILIGIPFYLWVVTQFGGQW